MECATNGRREGRGRITDVNRILTDLLVNFRRIVHRGLVNFSGELWYREGLPSDVFRRLVVRKENETPLDRFSGDYEELMTYADFRDLADIIAENQPLQERLAILKPRDDAGLLDRLYELEEIRRAIKSGRPTSDEDVDMLGAYAGDFRMALKTGKRASGEVTSSVLTSKQRQDSSRVGEDTITSFLKDGRLSPVNASDRIGSPAPSIETPPATEARPAPRPMPASEVGSGKTPVTDVSSFPGPPISRVMGPVETTESIEKALRDKNDAAILKALHVEVTEIADGILRRDPAHCHVVWEKVQACGWFDSHVEEYRLAPLGEFYLLSEDFNEAYSAGAKSSEIKTILADAGFAKLLLAMREMFLKSRSKA